MQVKQPDGGAEPPKLLDRVRNKLRVMHLAKRTEEAADWTFVSPRNSRTRN